MISILQAQRGQILANGPAVAANMLKPSERIAQRSSGKEEKMERERTEGKILELLEAIAENTNPGKTNTDKVKKSEFNLGGLGAIGTGLAIALGSLVGAISGHLKAIKAFGKALLPEAAIAKITKSFEAVKAFFTGGVEAIKGVFSSAFKSIASLFSEEGAMASIGKFFKNIINNIKDFFQPIKQLGSVLKSESALGGMIVKIQGIIGSIGEFFGGIASKAGSFSQIFGAVSKVVSKIFVPFTIIMTLWDTVKGMIAGFEEGGIIGGIEGAVKGFFNSLIFGPLDMIKNAVAWVLGVFGFDKAEEVLKSFSFEETFNQIVEALFAPVKWIKEKAELIIEWIKEKTKGVLSFFGIKMNDDKPKEITPGDSKREKKKATSDAVVQKLDAAAASGTISKEVATKLYDKYVAGEIGATEIEKAIAPVKGGGDGNRATNDPRRLDLSPQVQAITPVAAERIAAQSASNEMSKALPAAAAPVTSVVSAPTINNVAKSTAVIGAPVRNQDFSIGSYINSRRTLN